MAPTAPQEYELWDKNGLEKCRVIIYIDCPDLKKNKQTPTHKSIKVTAVYLVVIVLSNLAV